MSEERFFVPNDLLAQARSATGGLGDFGDDHFRPGLDVLCGALDREARLSARGRHLFAQRLVAQLYNRLRVEDHFRRNRRIADEVIAPPLVIVGLPRAGATPLHRLLARDPRFWSLAFWESRFPVPLPGETPTSPTARIREARGLVDRIGAASPGLLALHPVAVEEATAESGLLEHSLLAAFDTYADLPAYNAWVDQQDAAPAYRLLHRLLQFLQWQKKQRGLRGQRWVLQSPHHLLRMGALLQVFPEARVIQIHRDPVVAIPAAAQYLEATWRVFGEGVDPAVVGRTASERLARALNHTLKVRQQARGSFLDVVADDVVRLPVDVTRRVYSILGMVSPPELAGGKAAPARSAMAAEPRVPAPEAYGLSGNRLRRDFAMYRARHIEEID